MQKIIKLSITPFLSSPSLSLYNSLFSKLFLSINPCSLFVSLLPLILFVFLFFFFTFLTFSIFFVVLFGPHCLNQLYYLGVLLRFLMLTTSYFSDFFYQGICFDFEKPVMQTFE